MISVGFDQGRHVHRYLPFFTGVHRLHNGIIKLVMVHIKDHLLIIHQQRIGIGIAVVNDPRQTVFLYHSRRLDQVFGIIASFSMIFQQHAYLVIRGVYCRQHRLKSIPGLIELIPDAVGNAQIQVSDQGRIFFGEVFT